MDGKHLPTPRPEGNFLEVDYEINGYQYNMGYYLADGIYPSWSTLVKTIHDPRDDKKARFPKEQESDRKELERALVCSMILGLLFGTLSVDTMWEVIIVCVIMHNMNC
jgi:hypothetical protein